MRISDWSSDVCSSDLGDFAEVPPKGWKRLVPGGEVRLRGAGIVRCDEVVKDADGNILELRGTLDPYSRPGMEGANRKIKGTIHWVDATRAVPAEIRLYDRLFSVARPDDESDGKTRSEEHTSELQSLMRTSSAVFCLKKKKK